MEFEEAIEYIIKSVDAKYFFFNKESYKIEKNTSFVSSAVEHAQVLKIIEKLDQYGIRYELELNGSITILQ